MLTTQNNPWVKDFPILAADENGNRLVYLDSAAPTQHPQQVLDAVLHYYQKDNANPHRGVYELAMRATDAHEGARHRVAQFFHAEDDEIVFTQNTTESLNLVAYSYGLHFLHAVQGLRRSGRRLYLLGFSPIEPSLEPRLETQPHGCDQNDDGNLRRAPDQWRHQ